MEGMPPTAEGDASAISASTQGFDRLLRPKSIALVGASDNRRSLGGMVLDNLLLDFPGRVYPINSKRDVVLGVPALPNIGDVPEPVDLVIFLVAAEHVPGMVRECADRGDGGGLILSSGFAEAGEAGRRYQEDIRAMARSRNFPVIGPNCNGFFNGYGKIYANFALQTDGPRPQPGPVAVVSQSGGFGAYILRKAVDRHLRVSWFAATGNEADVTVSRVLRFLVEQPEVEVLLTFCEALRDPTIFLEAAARAAELDKVIVAVKTGNSEAAARAALSHTASIVGSEEVFDSVCRQYGIVRADSIDEMINDAIILQTGKRTRGNRLGVVTSSGGAGVLIADATSKVGLALPELPADDRAKLSSLIPAFGSTANPVDHTAALGSYPPDTYGKIVDVLDASDAIDAILTLLWFGGGPDADAVVQINARSKKPIAAVTTLSAPNLSEAGLPTFGDPNQAVKAIAALARVSARLPARPRSFTPILTRAATARRALASAAGKPFVLESLAKEVLALYGVPVSRELVAHGAVAAAAAATQLGGSVALKVLSYDLPHKSDTGGLRLGLRSPTEVEAAYDDLVGEFVRRHPDAALEAVLVQEMVPASLEIACGMQRDVAFGPTVAVGLGGTLVELLGRPALLRAPFDEQEALAAVSQVAGGAIAHAARGLSGEQMELVASILTGLSALALELDEVTSVDINPVRVSSTGVIAVDALLVVDVGL